MKGAMRGGPLIAASAPRATALAAPGLSRRLPRSARIVAWGCCRASRDAQPEVRPAAWRAEAAQRKQAMPPPFLLQGPSAA
jgi:hypothetical protein